MYNYNLPDAIRDCTYSDVHIQLNNANNTPFNLTGASIVIEVFIDDAEPPVIVYNIENNGITLIDALQGKFKTSFGVVDLKPGRYIYKCKVIFTNGIRRRFLQGFFNVIR